MKRKVIQIAGSTQLVSLPRQWAKRNNIKRGQEIEVLEDGNKVIITTDASINFVKVDVDISNMGEMTRRVIESYYRAGVDEMRITYNDPKLVEKIHESLASDIMIGEEIISQNSNSCILRYVAGLLEEFESILRRIFLLLINMSNETVGLLKGGRYDMLKNLEMLERTNNRMTSACRRIINKTPAKCTLTTKVGPMYVIIEVLEKLADEYKYIWSHYARLAEGKTKLNQKAVELFELANTMVRNYYELFYKYDVKKLAQIKHVRNRVVDNAHRILKSKMNPADFWLVHHSLMVATMIFSITGPYLVIKVDEESISQKASA